MMTLAVHYFCAFLDFSMIRERRRANLRHGELWALLSAGFFIIVREPHVAQRPRRSSQPSRYQSQSTRRRPATISSRVSIHEARRLIQAEMCEQHTIDSAVRLDSTRLDRNANG